MRTDTVIVGGTTSVSANTSDYAEFARALIRADPALYKALRLRLRGAGDLVASAARTRAAYSEKIPPTIRVRASRASVWIIAGGAGVPIAGLEELGNKGRSGNSVAFRHPVFGNREKWVNQSMHRYLAPAVDAVGPAAVEMIGNALADACREAATG